MQMLIYIHGRWEKKAWDSDLQLVYHRWNLHKMTSRYEEMIRRALLTKTDYWQTPWKQDGFDVSGDISNPVQ